MKQSKGGIVSHEPYLTITVPIKAMPKVYKDTPVPTTDKQKDIRCEHCNKLIVKVSEDFAGQLDIVCPRCSKKMIIN